MEPLKYIPGQTFVESSFFSRLSDLKLNEYKLDTSTRQIKGFATRPLRLTKHNSIPTLTLDFESFSSYQENEANNMIIQGHLLNVNTIEEFKNINKTELLASWGKELLNHIKKGNLERFNDFYILSYCDLKKYKFYYWVARPSLHSQWNLKASRKFTEKVNTTLDICFTGLHDNNSIPITETNTISRYLFVDGSLGKAPSFHLRNYLYYLALNGIKSTTVVDYRNDGSSVEYDLELDPGFNPTELKVVGWEKTSQGKLAPKIADLGLLIDPEQLATQAVDLNLKLMKWRIMPELDLDVVQNQRALLLGAGTLGSYVARCLMGWGVRTITFVDNGRVSYSNPVRQPLYMFEDCFSDDGRGAYKATQAAEALKKIFPGVNASSHNMSVPMSGHPATDEDHESFNRLCQLFDEHDVIFLLMDLRESRWLPTLLGNAKGKLVINAALGFDSYLVMRHGNRGQDSDHGTGGSRPGCYFCNDVVAPNNSLQDRTLDQMCTVTRPGGALMASSLAVELFVSILQHPEGQFAPSDEKSPFGEVPHQIRGFLSNFQQSKFSVPNYVHCSACSDEVIKRYQTEGWSFIKECLDNPKYLEEVSGLTKVQEEAELASERLMEDLDLESDDEWVM